MFRYVLVLPSPVRPTAENRLKAAQSLLAGCEENLHNDLHVTVGPASVDNPFFIAFDAMIPGEAMVVTSYLKGKGTVPVCRAII